MNRQRKSWASTFGIVAALALAAPAAGLSAQGSFDRTLKVSGPVDLEITSGSGAIHVRAGDSSSVQVHGFIRAGGAWNGLSAEEKVRRIEANPPIQQVGNLIRIGRLSEPDLTRNVSISYDVVAPAQTHLRTQTGSGDQSVDGIGGPLRASAGSGGIRLARIGGEVHAETGSGNIQADSIQGNLTASAGSGSIRALGVAGDFSAQTGSGDVHAEQSAPGRVKVSTGSGNVELEGASGPVHIDTGSGGIRAQGKMAADWHLETGSGGISVRLPAGSAFTLRAHTSSGSISTDGHPVTLAGTTSKRDWDGKAGAGGYLLQIKTASGDIRID